MVNFFIDLHGVAKDKGVEDFSAGGLASGVFVKESVVVVEDWQQRYEPGFVLPRFDLYGVKGGKLYAVRDGVDIDFETIEIH